MSFERLEPGTPEWVAYYANHIHRYRFAARELRERSAARILDAACGVGYGARHLAELTRAEVIAIDRDEGALAIARRDFTHARVQFLADDCETLAAARHHAPFEAVVSFETLEHLKQPEAFLGVAAELLVPSGVLIVSVPNGDVAAAADWEFHERDFNAFELEEILAGAGFRNVALHGQSLSELGRLRQQVRAEIHSLRFNPFARLGAWLQTRLRGRPPLTPALPEQPEDFVIRPEAASEIRARGKEGPFVIVAIATP